MKVELVLTDEQVDMIARRVAEVIVETPEPWRDEDWMVENWGPSPRTLLNYRKAGMPYERHGRTVYYVFSECKAWLAARNGRAYDRDVQIDGAAQPPDTPGKPPAPGPQEGNSYGQEAA